MLVDPQSVTTEALGLEQLVHILHQEWIVKGHGQLDMAQMPRALSDSHAAGGTY